jgi:hypothetical protein
MNYTCIIPEHQFFYLVERFLNHELVTMQGTGSTARKIDEQRPTHKASDDAPTRCDFVLQCAVFPRFSPIWFYKHTATGGIAYRSLNLCVTFALVVWSLLLLYFRILLLIPFFLNQRNSFDNLRGSKNN